jgi:4-amino-4-deoxy-L-arabinose transferase-like glycosyltransferase
MTQEFTTRTFSRPARSLLPTVAVFAVVMFFHTWKLPVLPRGLYTDERSIGYNAALIAQTGRDEYGVLMPVYFRAFGEYKNPVYIYATAMTFRLFGVSALTLRVPAALFFAAFLMILWLLVRQVTGRVLPAVFALVSAGCLPWFFPLSRVAFEPVSQLPLVTLAIWLVYRAYTCRPTGRWMTWLPFTAGLATALSAYAYTTGRLLAFVFMALIIAAYSERRFVSRHLSLTVGFVLGLLPYFVFSGTHPGAMTARFSRISYVYDQSLTAAGKMRLAWNQYRQYWGTDFFLFSGDGNRRHHIGFGYGELLWGVALLALLGIVWAALSRRARKTWRFHAFLLANLLAAPLAAALTVSPPHALRSLLIGLYSVIFAAIGLAALLTGRPVGAILAMLFLVWVGFEAAAYLRAYFQQYPPVSAEAFEDYDFERCIAEAASRAPAEIVVSRYMNQPYVAIAFARYLLPQMATTPIVTGEPLATKDRCVITSNFDPRLFNPQQLTATLSDEADPVTLHCY